MKHRWIGCSLALAALTLSGIACLGAPEESTAAPDPVEEEEDVGEAAEAVQPGCFAPQTCPAGTKTCSGWSAWTPCSGQFCKDFTECYPYICGRHGDCAWPGVATPKNRTRSCTMNATGQPCVEYGYSETLSSCGC